MCAMPCTHENAAKVAERLVLSEVEVSRSPDYKYRH